MTEKENQAMGRCGITYEVKSVIHFQDFKYERLSDPLRHAEIVGPTAAEPDTELKE